MKFRLSKGVIQSLFFSILFIAIAALSIAWVKQPAHFSQLMEWGIKGPVKVIDARYTYDSSMWSIARLDYPTEYNRRTVTYHNRKGNVDSILVYLRMDGEEKLNSRFVFEDRNDTIFGLFYLEEELKSKSKMYWIDPKRYVILLENEDGLNYKYDQQLNRDGLATVVDIYTYRNGSWEKDGQEENFFSKGGRLDSIVSTFGRAGTVLTNKDYAYDNHYNPIQSVKQRADETPYLVVRNYTYYED